VNFVPTFVIFYPDPDHYQMIITFQSCA